MLTLILQTQEGHQIELNVRPEDTFADLKNQYANHDVLGLLNPLEQIITNGAIVAENTKIFDYVSASANEWFSADSSEDPLLSQSNEVEMKFKECCARGCLNTEASTPGKPFFPLPTDHERLSVCLTEIGRLDLYDRLCDPNSQEFQRYFLCNTHFNEESHFLPVEFDPERTLSSVKSRNDPPRSNPIDEPTLANAAGVKAENREEANDNNIEGAFFDGEDSLPDVFDNIENYEHPGILCRLCGNLAEDPVHLYAVKTDDVTDEFSLADKINLCLPVTITITDPLPKQICRECHEKVNVCHDLAISSLQAEDKLRSLLRERKLCVDVDRGSKCPLCVEGEMGVVERSGVYRRGDLENAFFSIREKEENFENSTNARASTLNNVESTIDDLRIANPAESIELSPADGEEKKEAGDEVSRTRGIIVDEAKRVWAKPRIRYACNICKREFTRKGSLEKHVNTSHAGDSSKDSSSSPLLYKCKACSEAFSRENDARAHARSKHFSSFVDEDEADFPQSQCLVERLSLTCLYVCEYCEHAFTVPSALHEHRSLDHAASDSYNCPVCDWSFESHRQLATHKSLRSHRKALDGLDVRQYHVCKYCDKTFLHHSSHSSHVAQHRDTERPYLCRVCNVSFENYRDVSLHRDEAHPYRSRLHERPSPGYDCQYCEKRFPQEIALMKHIRTHTGERPYKCTICAKAFSQSSGLYTHLRTHSDLRPYSCTKCPRTFKIKGDRDNHVKKHTGNRPYKCQLCSKAFMTQHVYSQHCKIHTDERPYKCRVCAQAFRRSHVLTVHMRRHTGEKPHRCDVCPKAYRQRGDLLKHRRSQHAADSADSNLIWQTNARDDRGFDGFSKINKFTDIRGNSLMMPL